MELNKVKDLERILNCIPETVGEKHLDIRQQLDDFIFLMKDGDLGVVYSLEGVYDEPLNYNHLQEYLDTVKSSIEEVVSNNNVVVQVYFKQREINKRPGEPFIFSNTQTGKILAKEDDDFFKRGMIQREFFLCIRYKPSTTSSFFNSFLSKVLGPQRSNNVIENELEKLQTKKNELLRYLNSVEGQLSTKFRFQRIGNEKYISLLQNILNGGKSSSVYPEINDINKRIQSAPIKLNNKGDGLLIDGKETALFYLSIFPKDSSIGKIRHFLDEIPFKNIDFVWTISSGTPYYQHQFAESFYKAPVPAFDEMKKDFKSYKENVGPRNPEVAMSLRLIIHDYDDNYIGKISASANSNLWGRIKKENQIPFYLFTSSLPLNCINESNKIIGKYKTLLLSHAVMYLPIFNGPPNKAGVISRISRYGTPTKFNKYAGEGNRINAILGMSRAGKSSLINDEIMEFNELYPNSIIRIIDIKTSYEKLCDLIGGRVIRFSEDELRKQSYSPFSIGNEFEESDVDNVFILIKAIIILKNPSLEFSSMHDELLRDSLKHAYNNITISKLHDPINTPPHPIWTDVLSSLPISAKNLEDSGSKGACQAAGELATWSVNLYESGQYGFLFNRHESIATTNQLEKIIVYDLDGIQDETLRFIAAFLAFIRTSRDFKKLPTSITKLLNIDEFGVFCLGSDKAQKVSEEQMKIMIKTCAKQNVCMNTITNSVEDYTETAAGKTVWGNAAIKTFLPLGDMYSTLMNAFGEQFTDGEKQILKSLIKEPHFNRTGVYVISNNESSPYRGSFYNVLTPLRDAITSSSPSQLEYYIKRKKENQKTYSVSDFKPEEILIEMAEQIPFGKFKLVEKTNL